mmetsp:Transcript_100333/g.198996  ORF Transcript_100333/g.198996 Transcript_100333/m.198996 type:complete len:82 (+) Transcript_100333:336-581(+)
MTTMRSASSMVLSLCAITRHVAPCFRRYARRDAWTAASVFLSRAEVASSKTRSFGCRASARATARRCLCPPDSRTSPTIVS